MAKFGIALGSGPRGLGFESRYSDFSENPVTLCVSGFFYVHFLFGIEEIP